MLARPINNLSKAVGVHISRRYAASGAGFKAGKLVFYSVSAVTAGLGGTCAYAYFDSDFRKTLEDTFPPFKPVFESLLAGEKTGKVVSGHANQDKLNVNYQVESAVHKNSGTGNIEKLIEEIVDKKMSLLTSQQKAGISEKAKVARIQFEDELKAEMDRLNDLHAKHEDEMLRSQREGLTIEHKKELHEVLTNERYEYAQNLATAIAELTALETFLNGREEFDTLNRRAKKLWISCQKLKNALTQSSSGANVRRPVKDMITDIKAAAEDDHFVQSLIQFAPGQSGFYTEDDLLHRFEKVKNVSRRLARVGDNSKASLFQYFLSYVQSLFIFDSEKATSGRSKIDPENISNYDILSRTSYCLKKKDFESVIKLMSLLKGEPARVTSDWLQDLRTHLELKQMADILVAHASAQSIRSLY